MAAPQPTAPLIPAPPNLPSMPDVSTTLSNYLRNFSLWCSNRFGAKLDANTALPGILLMANDAPAGTNGPVFMIQVTSAGAVVATAMPLGSGQP